MRRKRFRWKGGGGMGGRTFNFGKRMQTKIYAAQFATVRNS